MMRLAPVLVLACLLSACGAEQSSIERVFIDGADSARAARADLDAQAILQGMEQARRAEDTVARAIDHASPEAPSPVTR